ncbi:hypothetical protein [Melittangium boletus]|uniref:hypothetical protein n=1 Tax=Melittangium boletus TaxID=83453 RepID=UPI003DA506E1
MTLIEITVLLFTFGGILLGAQAGFNSADDLPGRVLGLLLGGVAGGGGGILATSLLMGGLLALGSFLEWWRPDYPRCRQGRCGTGAYSYRGSKEPTEADRHFQERMLREDFGLVVYCNCGDRYVTDPRRRRFLRVEADGSLHPFRRHRPLGRAWLPDEGA